MKYKIILSAAVILAGLLLTSCTVKQEETKTQNLIIEEPSYSGTVTIFKENQKVLTASER